MFVGTPARSGHAGHEGHGITEGQAGGVGQVGQDGHGEGASMQTWGAVQTVWTGAGVGEAGAQFCGHRGVQSPWSHIGGDGGAGGTGGEPEPESVRQVFAVGPEQCVMAQSQRAWTGTFAAPPYREAS